MPTLPTPTTWRTMSTGREAVEQPAAVLLERQAVFAEQALDDVALFVVVERDAERGMRGDARPARPRRRELGERAPARPRLLALLELDLHLAAVGRFEVVDELVEARALVPDVEERQGGVVPHPVAVGVDRRRHRGVCLGGLHPVLPGGHHQAGGEAGDVPLEGPGQRLVEVTQVEVEVALGRGPEPEVQDVGVTAELDFNAAVGAGGEVGRHDGGRAAVEVPRRDGHALVPERGELGQPDVVLGQERVDGIVAAGLLVPLPRSTRGASTLAWRPISRRSAAVAARSCLAATGVAASWWTLLTPLVLSPSLWCRPARQA